MYRLKRPCLIVTIIKPGRCFAWRGFLLCICMWVCLSVCPLTKYLKKILDRSTSFLVKAFPVTQGGNHLILKKSPRGKGVCVGGGERGVKIRP